MFFRRKRLYFYSINLNRTAEFQFNFGYFFRIYDVTYELASICLQINIFQYFQYFSLKVYNAACKPMLTESLDQWIDYLLQF